MIKFPKNYKQKKLLSEAAPTSPNNLLSNSSNSQSNQGASNQTTTTGANDPNATPDLTGASAVPPNDLDGNSGIDGLDASNGAPTQSGSGSPSSDPSMAGDDSMGGAMDDPSSMGGDPSGSILSGGGGGGGSGGAGFTDSGGGDGGDGSEEPESPEDKGVLDFDDPAKAAKEALNYTTDIPEILKVVKASMENNDNAKQELKTIIDKLRQERNHNLHLVANRLELFADPFLTESRTKSNIVKTKNMKTTKSTTSRTNIIKEFIQEETNKEFIKQLNEEATDFTAVRQLRHQATDMAMKFEDTIVKLLGLKHPDNMDPNSQQHYLTAVQDMTRKFLAAVTDAVSALRPLPKEVDDNSSSNNNKQSSI